MAVVDSSLPNVVRERASLQPNDIALTYIDFDQSWDGVELTLTWSQLYRRMLNLAALMSENATTGDRALILAPQSLDYIVSFLASLHAGVVAVPLSVPMGGAHDERTASVLSDTSPAIVFTSSAVVDDVARYVAAAPGDQQTRTRVIELDRLELDGPPGAASRARYEQPDTIYLQYTSGSTRTPAGVMVSNQNLLANFEQIMTAYYGVYGRLAPPESTVVSWLPFYHDMGFILGLIFPVLTGIPAKLTSPIGFLQRPARWMQMLADNTLSFTAAPNFAFDLASRKTKDEDLEGRDLSGIHNILNGSERVQPVTLKRFTDRFARFGLDPAVIRPSYGMAETTVFVATRQAGEPPKIVNFDSAKLPDGRAERSESDGSTPLVSYGVVDTQLVRIVDADTCVECPEGAVGEIWVQGGNVATGYWNNPETTAYTFGGTIVDPTPGTPEAPWLRTGDSGFYSEGELFIVGRIKDLLIVYGRNHSPDDIEATIQTISPGRCVAIAVPEDGVEKLVAILELKQKDESPEEAAERFGTIKREVTSAISKAHGLSASDLVLSPQGSIPITTSGKPRRAQCVEIYGRDGFPRLDV
ncbi:AMP-binding protein [Mycobacterium sp.]|uniref:AMP-binding protein n=1 Tax=Mycobacterium sp. TaxID=1785 RepID=UPI003A8894EE